MAGEQTSYVGDDIKVLVNVIDSTGSHVAATINTSTTRLNGFSTVPTYNTIGTGIYEVVFASVTPAPAEGDRLIAKINGDIGGTAWTEYAVPIKIVADERGTDSVVVPTSDITAIKAKTDQLAFTVANQVDANSLTGGTSPADIYTYFTTGTNEDAFKADTSTLATAASISALNDLSSTDVTDAVWDASTSSHNVAGSFGRGFRQVKEGLVSADGQVNDLSATASSFITNLTAAVDDYYNGQTLHFISGSLAGQSQVIRDYNGTTKTITLDSALTSAPANADEFIVLSTHVHAITEIADGVWDEQRGTRSSGSFGYYLDAQVSSGGGGSAIGSGAISHEITVNVGGSPSDGVEVWVTTDSSGTNVVAGTLVTDAFGKASFMLDAGSYYLWAQKSGANFTNPTSFSVS